MKSRRDVHALAQALGGMPVGGVLGNSPAARMGIRYGDIVLEVNGMKTPTVEDFVAARNLRDDGAVVTIQRDAEVFVVELLFDRERPLPSLDAVVAEMIEGRIVPLN